MKRACWMFGAAVLGIPTTPFALAARQVTAEEIVAACAETLGGAAALDTVRTLRLTYRLPDHGGPATLEIKRPNLLRIGDFLVFDGRRAAMLDRPPLPDGTERPGELVTAEEWKDFEMQIGWFFPAFFDYPAEYRGSEWVEGIETHRLEVQLPLGARLTYFVDTGTNLPVMLESRVTIAGNAYRYRKFFGDYRETAGILYPREYTYYSAHVRKMFTVPIEALEINVHLDENRFAIPPRLR